MKKLGTLFLWLPLFAAAQQKPAAEQIKNLIVITSDGLRWQEVFKGMDTGINANKHFNQGKDDSLATQKAYWADDVAERRKKLMPFLWGTIAAKGQLYGNRTFNNKVDVTNPYWFSYPGYNEIFTGYPDTAVNSNEYMPNPHTTVLEYINQQPAFKGKVAAFASWDAFDRIFNKQRCGFPVVAAFSPTQGKNLTPKQQLINAMLKNSFKPFGQSECLDVFTHYAAMEYLQVNKPRVLYISYGETDEWAHAGRYKSYLDAINQVDTWVKDIWNFVQSSPEYKDNTAILITCDHGRGDTVKTAWTSHGSEISDSHEIWMAAMGPGLPAKGEVKTDMQLYQKQLAQTIASLLGLQYKATHPVADAIKEIKNK
jgi:hypothetical protein